MIHIGPPMAAPMTSGTRLSNILPMPQVAAKGSIALSAGPVQHATASGVAFRPSALMSAALASSWTTARHVVHSSGRPTMVSRLFNYMGAELPQTFTHVPPPLSDQPIGYTTESCGAHTRASEHAEFLSFWPLAYSAPLRG